MATVGLIPEAIHKYPQVSKYGYILFEKALNIQNKNIVPSRDLHRREQWLIVHRHGPIAIK